LNEQLRDEGIRVGRKRVTRLMRENAVVVRIRRRFRITRTSKLKHPIAPNHLARRFAPADIGALDRVCASDITYIDTLEGWLYLAVILGLRSRRVVGIVCSMSRKGDCWDNALVESRELQCNH
jgi:transposase InsO family protein